MTHYIVILSTVSVFGIFGLPCFIRQKSLSPLDSQPAAATTHPSQPLSVTQLNLCNRQSVAQLASSAIGSQSRGSQAVQSVVSRADRKQCNR
ncbi:hypothetical protein ES332_D01G000700v1 [Gossypium tomentosum]|uniref:Uncharacterized protein n=1 Tax=Gossypium tomentosum TaxID=34277 RepID=A0A5D2M3B6_GOSTO|nr:hypothetical protein ES332_D01G000700v1 [Gossypium tomentosum]